MKNNSLNYSSNSAGLYTLSIRLVIGWTYFSAFWRRLVLENKLDPDQAGYVGEKFNHFLPNALGIKPLIEYLVTHPEILQVSMIIFTIVEALVGLLLILGFFTRLASAGVFFLALGILLGSGWLGTTCLDEWQIGVLGIAGGLVLFLSGSSIFSLDGFFTKKGISFTNKPWFLWMASGPLPLTFQKTKILVLTSSLLIFGVTLFTNQYFHGGVLGALHNKSVRPLIEISDVHIKNSELSFQVYRTEGADVYGSFLIGIQILNSENQTLYELNGEDLSRFPAENIHNYYVSEVKPGKHSLIIPLGARADLKLNLDQHIITRGYTLKLIDVSGIEWTSPLPGRSN